MSYTSCHQAALFLAVVPFLAFPAQAQTTGFDPVAGGAYDCNDTAGQDVAWGATATLGLVNDDEGLDGICFGSDVYGFPLAQLEQFTINGQAVSFDQNGFLVVAVTVNIPEPIAVAVWAGIGGLALAARRGRRR